jgi:surfeit locus 1 family protein
VTKRLHWGLTLAALLMAALTTRLGLWQLDRAAQKTALQATLEERAALPALTLPELPATAAAAEGQLQRRAELRGTWLAQHTVALENRPMAQRVGFYIVTPLRLADGSVVLVQRGWLPRDLRDRSLISPFATPAGEQRVVGRIAPQVPRLYEFDAEASGPIRQNLPLDAFGRETGLPLRPWVLIQDDVAGAAADGLLRQWPAPATGVAKHHGYAFQWFALTALTIGLYVWFQFIRPRRPGRSPGAA